MRYFIAWFAGTLAYFLAMGFTVYDGILSLIFQPITGAFYSAAFLLVAVLLGLPLRLTTVRSVWHGGIIGVLVAGGLAVLGIASIFYSLSPGHLTAQADPTSGEMFRTGDLFFGLGGFLSLIFGLAHWPNPRLLSNPAA